jgi:iron complex outermembrane receptor protein
MFNLSKKASNWSLAFALAAGVGATGTSLPVLADDEGMLEEVVVTGSRIRRSNADSSTPVTVLSRADIDGVGTTNIGVYLEKLPSNIAANNQSNSTFTISSFGLVTNSLRGLGQDRTLTLVNGKRFVSGVTPDTGSAVDLSMIPTPLIERVEVVTGGASAVYGSDAIAGVINIILKDDFEGISINARTGVSAESDRESNDVDVTLGANFDKGNAYISMGYSDEEGLYARDRGLIDLFPYDTDGDGQEDTNGFLGSSGLPDGNFGGFFGTGAPANLATGVGSETGDRYNRGGERALFNPLERRYARAGMTYEISDEMKLSMNAGYSETLTFTEIESFFYNIPDEAFQKNNQTVFDLDIATNLVMPEALKQALLGLSYSPTTIQDVGNRALFVRRMTDVGNRGGVADRSTAYLDGSFEYEINDDYTAEIYGSWGRTRFANESKGLINNDRVRNGLDVELVNGLVQCVSAVARAEGCVPLNFYAPAGQMTAAEVAYITAISTANAQNEQTILGGVVSGETPFEMAGGRVGVAAGVEYRKEKGFVTPSGLVTAGSTTTNQSNPTAGAFDVTDYFAEVRVPVLDKLSLEAAVRFGDYSTIGNATTWKLGFEAPVLDWVKFRGTVSESVRAPNISELFDGGGESFAQVNDLCDLVTSTTVGTVADNCRSIPAIANRIATGLGNDNGELDIFRLTQVEIQSTGGVVGGNPNVGEETADSWTIGAAITVPMVEGLTIVADWYDIEVNGAIAATDRSEVIRRCFNATAFDATCAGLATRDINGALATVNSSQSNENNLKVSGMDVDVMYRTELEELNENLRGSLTTNLLYNFQNENEITGITSGLTDDLVGEVLTPEHRWTLSTNYRIDDLSVNWRMRYWAEVGDNNEASDSGRLVGSPLNDLDGIFYHDLRGGYDINENINVYFGINNVLDEEPPVLGQGTNYGSTGINTAPAAYDVIGRRYYAGVSVDL